MRFRRSCRSLRSSCSTVTKPRPQADLNDDGIELNGHEKRKRTPHETVRPATVAAVVSPYVSGACSRGEERDSEAKLEEAVGLARAIDLDVRLAQTAPLRRLTPATLIGKGVVERIKAAVEEQDIG